MRDVLVVTPDFPPQIGGIQTLAYGVAKGMLRYTPRVVAGHAVGARAFDEAQDFQVRRSLPMSNQIARILALNAAALREAVRSPPAAFLCMHVLGAPAPLVVGRLLGRPVLVYAHAQELVNRPGLARFVFKRADAVIAVSASTRARVEELRERAAGVHVVHPGVDAASEVAPNRAFGRKDVVVVARLEDRYKGHDVLLTAMAHVRRIVPEAHLHVIGEGRLRPTLEERARLLGVSDAVTFHGRIDATRRNEIMRGSWVFAMPTRLDERGAGEGFGIAYIEAGALGLPVVAGRAGGAVDAVRDGETGILVDPSDPRAVAKAILTFFKDRELSRRMGLEGWSRARELNWPHVAAQIEQCLDDALVA